MPEPIEYRILRNLQTAIAAIAVAGGYHYNVAAAAVKLDPNQDVEALITEHAGPRPFVILELRPESFRYDPAEQVLVGLPVIVHWIHDSDPSVDEDRLRVYLRGCADIEQAIAVDSGRGGLAVDTRIVRRSYDTADGALVWAMVELDMRVYRTYGRPNG